MSNIEYLARIHHDSLVALTQEDSGLLLTPTWDQLPLPVRAVRLKAMRAVIEHARKVQQP